MIYETVMSVDFLLFVECFIVYSMIGWLVESIYMSICNRKLTNRGFAKGPFCPIYGCGGAIGYLLLHSFANNVVALYFIGAVTATCFEFFVGMIMQHFLHQVWWDYNDKFLNYKGIICLESSIAWGFYAVVIVKYLNDVIVAFVQMIPKSIGKVACVVIFMAYMIDFFYHLLSALDMSLTDCKDKIVENVRDFRTRW